MLPDFRFVIGGFLAIAVLGVAGLGLVTSVQLVREAHMAPLEDTRSLAFSGHTEWNQFYDPAAARRFEGSGGKAENPGAAARPQTPEATSRAIAHAETPERTASIPAYRVEPDVAHEKTAETVPAPVAETPTAIAIAAPPAEAAGVPVETAGAPASDGSRPTESEPPPTERVASAPAASPELGIPQETQMPTRVPTLLPTQEPGQPQAAGAPSWDSAPPIPRARPEIHFRKRIARTHIRRFVPTPQQTVQNPGFPAPWPGYDNQFAGAPTTKKNNSKLTGTVPERPQ
jgi:hypothetical protein